MVEFLIYTLCSGVACYGYAKLFSMTIDDTADELGYVFVGERVKPKLSKKIGNFALSFIPFISTGLAIYFFVLSLYLNFGNKKNIEGVFAKNPRYLKASSAKELFEQREKMYNLQSLEDAMKIDGATDEIIAEEIKKVKDEGHVLSEKEMKKIKAMSDAELWLLDIELNTSLSESEKVALYTSYVKDFSKNKANAKAIQKTLKFVDKKED